MKRSGILRIKVEVKGDDSDGDDSNGDDSDGDDSAGDDSDGNDSNSVDDKTLKPEVKKDDDSKTLKLEGAIELHRLVVEDFDELKRRAEDIDEAIVNATCSLNGWLLEVSQSLSSIFSPGHTFDACLQAQSLGLSAPAAEQGRRSKQSCNR